MPLADRNILISPNRGTSTEPNIRFTGADTSTSATITLRVLNSGTVGTLSFEGSAGQLFSMSDTFTGTIFSVNDVSGIPSIEVLDTGLIRLAQYNGYVSILSNIATTSTTTGALLVTGGVGVGGMIKAGGISTAQQTINVNSTSTNLDFSLYDHFLLEMTTNTTLTISNAGVKIGCTGNILIRQDATGGRTFTRATQMKTPLGGAAIDQVTASNALSLLTYYVVDSSTVIVNYIGNFA